MSASPEDSPNILSRLSVVQKIGRVGAYAGSRIAVSAVPMALTPFIVRLTSPAESTRLLAVLAAATFTSNAFASWLEQVVYRFPLASVRKVIRRALWVESGLAAVIFAAAVPFSDSPIARFLGVDPWLLVSCVLLITTDLVFRVSVATIQMLGRERLFISINLARIFFELFAGIVTLALTHSSSGVLAVLAIARLLTMLIAMRGSTLFGPIATPVPQESRWLRYGLSLAAWFLLLQTIHFIPQWFSVMRQEPVFSTAFLAGYRIILQIALLPGSVLLLYMHPTLFRRLHEKGQKEFILLWLRYLYIYVGGVSLFILLFAASYSYLTAVLLTAEYGRAIEGIGWILPGALSWMVAGYVQKIIEAGGRVVFLTYYLGGALLVFVAGCLHVMGPETDARTFVVGVAISLSLAFTLYSLAVSVHAGRILRHEPTDPRPWRVVGLISGCSLLLSVGLAWAVVVK